MIATEKIVGQMLKENTGTHMLDSGGVGGRSWQRNQDRDFASEPEAVLDQQGCTTLSVYHWLVKQLKYDPVIDSFFAKWGSIGSLKDKNWLAVPELFCDPENGPLAKMGFKLGGIYGDSSGPFCTNTYNGEDALSQVIQFWYGTLIDGPEYNGDLRKETVRNALAAEIDGRPFVLLSIHGGCDVRGGYTQPRFFWVDGDDGTEIFDNAKVSLYCPPCGSRWDSDNGGYSFMTVESYYPETDQDYFVPKEFGCSEDLINEDGQRVCPHCEALNTLEVYPW